MAQMPTIASTAGRRILPSADLRVEGVSPAAFGAAVGAGLQQLGDAGADAGKAVQQFELVKQEEANRLAEFDRQTQFVAFGSDQATKLEEARRDLSGPAQDFTKTFMGSFDTDAAAFLEKVPPRDRHAWQARMAQLRAGVAGDALRSEFGQRDSYYKTTIADSLEKLQNGAMQQPEKLADWLAQGEQIIGASGLSAQDKLEYVTRWKGAVAVAAAQGDVMRDPEGAMKRLGGLPREVVQGVVSPTSSDVASKIINVESGGKPNARSKTSSASGLGQFTDSTWLSLYKQKIGAGGLTDAQILAKKTDPELSRRMTNFLVDANKAVLGDKGLPATDANVYTLHFLGPEHGVDLIRAPADKPVESFLPREFITANKSVLAGKTAGQVREWAARKMGGNAAPPGPGQSSATPNEDGYMGFSFARSGADTNTATWDKRGDGSTKGHGFLGLLQRPGGGVSSEISIGVEIGGKEVEIPTMVPNLSKPELTALMTKDESWVARSNDPLAKSIRAKAIDHASRRISAGQSPFAQAGESPDMGQSPTVDPRYADLPVDAREQLIGAAQREIDRKQAVAAQAEHEAHSAWLNGFMNDLNDGKAGQADIDAARKSGVLTDFDEINRAQTIVEQRNKQVGDLNTFNTLLATPGFTWNPFDERQTKAVEAAVKSMGGTPQAAFDVWQRTGILADSGAVALRGSMISTNPQQVAAGAAIASNMLARNPNAFAGVKGGNEIEQNALLYGHLVNDLGYAPGDAAARVAQQNTPEMRRKIEMGKPETQAFRTQILKTDVQSKLGSAFGSWFDLSRDPRFVSPEQRNVAAQDYADIAADHFARYGDAGAAEAFAMAQMKKLYGVVNGRLMKYPPTRSYPAVGGSQQYIFDQAAADIKQVTGRAIDPAKVYLMPIPTATAEAFRAGKPAPYSIHYLDEVNGQQVYRVLNGKAFFADPGAEARRVGTQRKAEYNAARQRQQAAEQFQRDARVARFGYLPGDK